MCNLTRIIALTVLWIGTSTFALGENVTEEAAKSLFPEVLAIVGQFSTNQSSWSTNKDRIIDIYKQFGFSVTVDDEREFGAVASHLMFALVPNFPADVYARNGGPTNRQTFLAYVVKRDDFSPLPFKQEMWHQDKIRDRTRYRMFKDFKRTHVVVGMPVDQLVSELGEPNYKGTGWLSYGVGPEIGVFVIDDMTLDFQIKDGMVTGYRFVSH